jgi:hypothetical protein
MTDRKKEFACWRSIAARYQKNAAASASEPARQLAYLVLADYCTYVALEERGGPSEQMLSLAERLVGERPDEVFTIELAKVTQ